MKKAVFCLSLASIVLFGFYSNGLANDYMREFMESQRELLRQYDQEAWRRHEEADQIMREENARGWQEFKQRQDELLRQGDSTMREMLDRYNVPLLPGQLEAQRSMRRQMMEQQHGSGWQIFRR